MGWVFAREALDAIEREDRKMDFAKAMRADLAALARIAKEEGVPDAEGLDWDLGMLGWSDDHGREPGWTRVLARADHGGFGGRDHRELIRASAEDGEEEDATARAIWESVCAHHRIGDGVGDGRGWRKALLERLGELRFGGILAEVMDGSEMRDRLGEEKAGREIAVEREIERKAEAELGEGGLLEGMLPKGSKVKARVMEEGGRLLLTDLFALNEERQKAVSLLDPDWLKKGIVIGKAGDGPEEAWRGAARRLARHFAARGGPGNKPALGEEARARAQAALLGEDAEFGKTKRGKPRGL